MMKSLTLLALILALPLSAIAQGGFGGGGAAGAAGNSPMTGDEATYGQILTPGDKGEWVIDAKDGETILATAVSTVFDAALEIVDEQSKVIASNDDIEPGNQTARLLYRFQKAGKYRLWVKGYKSAAGGPFTLNLRRFVPIDGAVGRKSDLILDKTGSIWVRFQAKKDQPMALYIDAKSVSIRTDILGPTGEEIDGDSVENNEITRIDLRSVNTGDYFLRISSKSSPNSSVSMTPTVIPVRSMSVGSTLNGALNPYGVEIVTVPLEEGDLVRVGITGNGPRPWLTSGALDATSTLPDAVQLLYNMGKGGFEVIYAKKKTTIALTVSQPFGLPTSYEINVAKAMKAMTSSSVKSRISVGGGEFYSFSGKAGELVEFKAGSTEFDCSIRLIGPGGASISSNDDGGDSLDSTMTTLLPEDGLYIIEVICQGMGGSGTYELNRNIVAPKAIAIGEAKTGDLGAGKTEVWSFKAKTGQRILLGTISNSAKISVRVFGPKGEQIGTSREDGLTIVKVGGDGDYSIWVSAIDGNGQYRLRLIDIDQ